MPADGLNETVSSGSESNSASTVHDGVFYRFLEKLPAAAYTCDADGMITYFNQHAVRVWGREPRLNDPIDRYCGSFKLYSVDGAPIAHDECWMALALKMDAEFNGQEIVIERPDGDRVIALAHANPIHDDHGRLIGAVNVLVDISERHNAAKALRARERQFAAIFEQATVGIAETDLTGRFVLVNDRYCQLVGRPRDELLTLRMQDITHPEDLPRNLSLFGRAIAGDEPFVIEKRYVRPDGSTVWVSNSVSVIRDEHGAPQRAMAVSQDITERRLAEEVLRESEAQLKDFLEHASEGLHWVGPDGIILWTNQAELEMLGYERDEYVGRHIAEFHADPVAIEDILTRLARNETLRGYEARLRCKDGSLKHVLINSNVLWRDGKFVHTRCFTRDITDLKRAAVERERLLAAEKTARVEAEAANRVKSEFLATMSHELRTPLNAILGYTELVELGIHGPVTEGQRGAMARVRRSADHLLGLVNSVLDFAKVEAGVVRYDIAAVPIHALVSSLETLIAPQIAARRVRYHHEPCDPSITVRADAEKVKQIVVNLLTNAIKFTPPEGQIAVTCEPDENWVRVHVRDTGPGVAPDKLEVIFEPFVQVGQRLDRPGDGVGLGLAISREMARAMGGDVSAASTLGQGSTFTLKLPRAG